MNFGKKEDKKTTYVRLKFMLFQYVTITEEKVIISESINSAIKQIRPQLLLEK